MPDLRGRTGAELDAAEVTHFEKKPPFAWGGLTVAALLTDDADDTDSCEGLWMRLAGKEADMGISNVAESVPRGARSTLVGNPLGNTVLYSL